MHSFPDHILILFLNARKVGSFLILSYRVFQRKLPLKDSDSSPKLVLFIVSKRCLCALGLRFELPACFVASSLFFLEMSCVFRYFMYQLCSASNSKGNYPMICYFKGAQCKSIPSFTLARHWFELDVVFPLRGWKGFLRICSTTFCLLVEKEK